MVLEVKNLPANAENIKAVGSIPGFGRSPEEGMATHSSILAWRISMGRDFWQATRLEWVAMPSSGDLPNPGIEPRSLALQADSLSSEPPVKPKNTGVVAYPFSSESS